MVFISRQSINPFKSNIPTTKKPLEDIDSYMCSHVMVFSFGVNYYFISFVYGFTRNLWVSGFMVHPKLSSHLIAKKKILRYVKNILGYELFSKHDKNIFNQVFY